MRIFLFKHTGLSQGREYKFSSVNQAVLWPQEDGIRLGMAGAWNLLFRAGIRPHIVDENNLPENLAVTHTSLFDGSIQGIHRTDKPAFSFQGHPEASPGPADAAPLFDHFIDLIVTAKKA